jgi:uncharacterized membrane protein
MFSKNGVWKEFGIGRNSERYTWMPFWLFAIIWAIISYMIILIFVHKPITITTELVVATPTPSPAQPVEEVSVQVMKEDAVPKKKSNMKPGYYVLDENATSKRGIPKYIYLGPEAPNLVYNDGAEDL